MDERGNWLKRVALAVGGSLVLAAAVPVLVAVVSVLFTLVAG